VGVRLSESFVQELKDQVVRNQAAGVHVAPGLPPEGGAGGDGRAQEVPGGEVRNPEILRQPFRLRPLTGSGGSEEDDSIHRFSGGAPE
jgi:hypothetical protein